MARIDEYAKPYEPASHVLRSVGYISFRPHKKSCFSSGGCSKFGEGRRCFFFLCFVLFLFCFFWFCFVLFCFVLFCFVFLRVSDPDLGLPFVDVGCTFSYCLLSQCDIDVHVL